MWNLQRSQIKLVDQKEAHMTSSRLAVSNVCTDRDVGSAAGKLEGNGPVESAASREIKDKHKVH